MTKNIYVEEVEWQLPQDMEIELVERKGIGHPDYIADSASEEVSIGLSNYYIEHYGRILHHNVDKVLIVGGQSDPKFRGGRVLHPIYILVSGRATTTVKTDDGIENVPIGTIIMSSVKKWIKNNMRYLDPEEHVIVDYKIGKGSEDLTGIFDRGLSVPHANDTSFGIGFYPYSTLENVVYQTERFLNSPEMKKKIPELGEDIKVMGLRNKKEIDLTIAGAMISKLVDDKDHYINIKEKVVEEVYKYTERLAPEYEIKIFFNTGDSPEKNIFYLTVTGTSAEHGDDGATGRGNRANGLITPMRPMSLEATAGKNPVNHVGKIYNIIAMLASKKIYEELHEEAHVIVQILSQIGRPIDDPLATSIKLTSKTKPITNDMKEEARNIIEQELKEITKYTKLILEKKVQLF
ncbi:methionine adenosyltransferase [Fervidicoccus fontis]|jgi:S-adenosylmethionine synthetase|uniref:S-adenosylmethionine synthetase n=2 Tax=Fervidicoccus fontis TaxID=683846 RepID=H9ZZX7_FERFK|nr:methionine adenosyltransferase [Fervidicoccus fontis]AFH42284.1 S-adenosylmethionine synthetase [Fervidicoccus fontis Kam940]MBE9391034.1 methionine adenosyltransferase [Fervidicoccus fontis]